MKPIKTLDTPPPGLALYLKKTPTDYAWDRFRDQDSDSYRELRGALVQLQHGLCGYCEQIVRNDDCQVEHVIPRSSTTLDHPHDLESANMLAGCKGGTATNLYGPETKGYDPYRVGDVSCGQAKGDVEDPNFIDPRTLPRQQSVFQVGPDGRMISDETACLDTGVTPERAQRTIDILGLNVNRLMRARANRWQTLNEVYSDCFEDADIIHRAAQAELLPDEDGNLPPFFTTNRSYFMPISNTLLAQSNGIWV